MRSPSSLFKARTALQSVYREHGIGFVWVIIDRFFTYYWRKLFGSHTFELAGQSHRYLIHPYILNVERTVEIAIVRDFLQGKTGNILEVGNVLATYLTFPHDIVDKYEEAPGVINEDIVTFAPGKKYDYIVTISTLEHVGWDETPREPEKIARAVARLKELLTDTGTLFASMPLGYNPHLDERIRTGQTGFSQVYFLKRTTKNNQWREAKLEEVVGTEFGSPFACANAIFIGLHQNKG